jgi:hypothetical protein
VVGALFCVVVDVVVGGVVVIGAREIFTGDEWKLRTPTSPATVPNMMNGDRLNGTYLFVA